MPRTKTEERRRAILHAAAKVLAEKGYQAATVADIAGRLRMGHGTFYRYFKSKLDIFNAVIDEVVLAVGAAIANEDPTRTNTLGEYRSQVERIAGQIFEAFIADRDFAQLLFWEAPGTDRDLDAKLADASQAFGQMTEAYLENGVRKGFLRADLDIRTTALAINALAFEGTRLVARSPHPAAEAERWKAVVCVLMFDGIGATH
jgi:AcrR family transcriptional regulator